MFFEIPCVVCLASCISQFQAVTLRPGRPWSFALTLVRVPGFLPSQLPEGFPGVGPVI